MDGSEMRSMAWCGRLALPFSFAVRETRRVPVEDRIVGEVAGDLSVNLDKPGVI